ncbi:fungal specific transcription factor domain-containing protein [Trichoderma breve]|uniref:Fungal specific transcription factor domain-containing protein n=1 Tax=Trichoderma breve TaxID=2034170 RepID=A0A9W9E2L9_9HYPO|nr:fungal specific transcription factor domain-containing protein [Trichoderma breve]KAJ4854525.1 fungal specific transcription factor domain-containing protein [Trichoderma breve]
MPQQSPDVPSKHRRRLSCKRCQYRKFKCSRTEPCGKCMAADVKCEYPVIDRKRTPASSEYALSLERRVQSLESFITSLRNASHKERERMLLSVPADQLPNLPADDQGQREALKIHERSSTNLELDLDGSLIFHGATSIYRVESHGYSQSRRNPLLSWAGSEGDVVIRALTDFFRWQYPYFMFVYREAFLRDHFGDRKDSKYWSAALLMALCALGAMVASDDKQRRFSEQFFLAAESIIMVSGLAKPSIPTVQTFLCLAFYEIGRGNLSKGWSFSGIAFRMAQDLGLQRDPDNWVPHDPSLGTHEDGEIRRRIYWGCYNSDKLISLILGRPVHLVYDAAEVDALKILPDGPAMEYWRPVGFEGNGGDTMGGISNIPFVQEQIRLSRIVESMMTVLFPIRINQDAISRTSNLDKLNLELLRWYESLPTFAKWTRWDTTNLNAVPGLIALHLFYNSARIALNHDNAVAGHDETERNSACQYCTTSAQNIITLVRTYRVKYDLRHSPLVLVYACVQAIRVVSTLGTPEEEEYLTQALGECSGTWALASQMQLRLATMSPQ